MLSTLCRAAVHTARVPVTAPSAFAKFPGPGLPFKSQVVRAFKTDSSLFSNNDKHFIRRARERVGLKEKALGPTTGTPFKVGKCSFFIVNSFSESNGPIK